jgi:hypothetical protein
MKQHFEAGVLDLGFWLFEFVSSPGTRPKGEDSEGEFRASDFGFINLNMAFQRVII